MVKDNSQLKSTNSSNNLNKSNTSSNNLNKSNTSSNNLNKSNSDNNIQPPVLKRDKSNSGSSNNLSQKGMINLYG